MERNTTVGEAVDKAIAKATAELAAARNMMFETVSLPDDLLNALSETRKHFAEAVDAILCAAGSFGGENSKRALLKSALAEHGFELK